MKNHTRRLGSRKFALMTDKQINVALKKAERMNLISTIPECNDQQLLLLREIAVVTNGGYAFLEKNHS